MKKTLLLRLAAPLQSWGTRSRFEIRDTEREPTKSGVVGLLAAALGRDRTEPVADLAKLPMTVRVDQEGELAVDYQTVAGARTADNKKGRTITSHRYYLADASFLVALHVSNDYADPLSADKLAQALRQPAWPLALGRRSYTPALPIHAGSLDLAPMEALRTVPWHAWNPYMLKRARMEASKGTPRQLRVIADDPDKTSPETRNDNPLSFASNNRQYHTRHVVTSYLPLTDTLLPPAT